MGKLETLKRYVSPRRAIVPGLPPGLVRRKPRAFAEWRALRGWRKLPAWEVDPIGYHLRLAREKARFTQAALALRLGCSQQAIAQAERWGGNPTVDFIRRWAEACGSTPTIELN